MKYGLCNEIFGDLSFEDSCRLTAEHGFSGLEIAPFTLADDPRTLKSGTIQAITRSMSDYGLDCIGLHWILKAPEGLHATTGRDRQRRDTWDFLKFLTGFCRELGGDRMVLGSGKQRNAVGMSVEEATERLIEGLKDLAPVAAKERVKILIEPLPAKITDVVNTLAQAESVIRRVGSPWISSLFDFHNCDDESLDWPGLITEYHSLIDHVHLNTESGDYLREPESGHVSAFHSLREHGYDGWVSLEIFHFDDAVEKILAGTKRSLAVINKSG